MQWNTSYTESVHTFANTINTHEGGTHEEGFRAALTALVNSWGEEWDLIKKREDRVSGDDIREGLTAIISIKLAEPQFEGQTKTKLGNTEAKGFVQRVGQRPARRLAGAEPRRGQGHRPQGAGRGVRPGSPPARRATWPAPARACSAAAACPASSRTASRPTPRSARSSSSRATRRVARPARAPFRRAAQGAGSGERRRQAARGSSPGRRMATRQPKPAWTMKPP